MWAEAAGAGPENLSSCFWDVISKTILDTFDDVKISGVCLRESGLGSEGVFCDLNLVDTQGRRRWTGTCPYGQSISTIVLPLMWNCLSCFLIL